VSSPDVGVVIPVRDGERYLAETIRSVLAQTLSPADVVVVDDGSADATAAVLRGFAGRVRAVHQGRAGAAAAVNRGVDEVKGNLLAFLDADDLWDPHKLALQVAALARDPELDAVFCHISQFVSPELSAQECASIACPVGPHPGISRCTLLIRRSAYEHVGSFDGSWAVGEFVDWWSRAVDADVTSIVLSEVLVHRRLHP
jgi:glycosyltransferase involved in cell wall biosynthesis